MIIDNTGKPVFFVMGSHQTVWGDRSPVVSVEDRDDDGSFDFLNYYASVAGTTDSIEIMDRDLDGQPDIRVRYSSDGSHLTWLWVENGWYEIGQGQSVVLVDGVETPYEVSNGKFLFVEREAP